MMKENVFEMDLRGEKDYKTGYEDGYEEGAENGIMAERRSHRKTDIFFAVMVGINLVMGIVSTCCILSLIR